jgi:HlyD family secretion protein
LLDQKVISQSEFETAQQAYESAKANYAAAESGIKANQASVQNAVAGLTSANKDLQKATLVAPMDGVVTILSVKKGESVAGNQFNVGTEIMRIADLSNMEVQVDVGENDIPKVKLGDTANVTIDAFNNRKFKGVVYKIANPTPSLAESSGASSSSTTVTNYEVHIHLLPSSYEDLIVKNQPFPFRPNMTASAEIQTQTHTNVLSVPLNAVTTRTLNDVKNSDTSKNKKPIITNSNTEDSDLVEVVFTVQPDGKVKIVPVTTSIQDINNIEITGGLKSNEQVVTGPYDIVSKTMKNGDKVKIVSKDELVKGFEKK